MPGVKARNKRSGSFSANPQSKQVRADRALSKSGATARRRESKGPSAKTAMSADVKPEPVSSSSIQGGQGKAPKSKDRHVGNQKRAKERQVKEKAQAWVVD